MMKKWITMVAFTVAAAPGAFAFTSEYIHPDLKWVEYPHTTTGAFTSLGIGLLDDGYVTGSGTSIFFDVQGNYAFDENFSMNVNIPTAGTISDNQDGYGLGNISLSGKYFLPRQGDFIAGFSTDIVFATATSDAVIGTSTRKFYRYTQDQWAIVPHAVVGWEKEKLQIIGQIGLPLQIFEDDGEIEGDTVETSLSYDVGFALALNEQRAWYVTAEAGGYSTLSLDSSDEQTEFFASLGGQYKTNDSSFGLALTLPLTEDVRDVHDVIVYGNYAYHF